jgi:uncharacterized RDD family membrane protein YckC
MDTTINISKVEKRLGAFFIDSVILGVVGFLLGLSMQDFLVSIGNYGLLLGLAIAVAYQTIGNSKITNGQTIGKRIIGIQVVDRNGETIGIGKSFLRALILCVPYFTRSFSIPGISDSGPISIVISMVESAALIGLVVVYIFNKETRQSLHDLAVGSYVVTTERNELPSPLPKVSRTPFYALFAVIIVLIGLSASTFFFGKSDLSKLMQVNDKVKSIGGVLNSSVFENTTYAGSNKTKSYAVTAWVVKLPGDNMVHEKIVKDIVSVVLNDVADIDSFDVISISLTRQFNIGIASLKNTERLGKSPAQWREKLK